MFSLKQLRDRGEDFVEIAIQRLMTGWDQVSSELWIGPSQTEDKALKQIRVRTHMIAGLMQRLIILEIRQTREAPGNKKTKTARVWTYMRDERPWSGSSQPCPWYQFTIDRKGEHPVGHLAGYMGWVHADGYSGFNVLFGENKADEMACMAHVRHKFVDVFAFQGSVIAEQAIRRIAKLYAVDKEGRVISPEARVALRQTRAKPIFDDLQAWLHAQLKPSVNPTCQI